MTYTNEYWEKRFDGNENPRVVKALKRIYGSYPADCMPQGTADPMYIMNIIALELGIGDGQGNFDLPVKQAVTV